MEVVSWGVREDEDCIVCGGKAANYVRIGDDPTVVPLCGACIPDDAVDLLANVVVSAVNYDDGSGNIYVVLENGQEQFRTPNKHVAEMCCIGGRALGENWDFATLLVPRR